MKSEMDSHIQKLQANLTKLSDGQSYMKMQLAEINPKEDLEAMNKRLRTMFNEIDEMKLLNERYFHVARRLENVESKA